jgi:hypothetical protein
MDDEVRRGFLHIEEKTIIGSQEETNDTPLMRQGMGGEPSRGLKDSLTCSRIGMITSDFTNT